MFKRLRKTVITWPLKFWLVVMVLLCVLVGMGVGALLLDIAHKQHQAQNPFFHVVELHDDVADPAIWGKNFPFQYDRYLRTVDQQRTRFGGSEAMPRTPTQADPRSVVAQSRLEEDPRLAIMWAGYAFAVDFREERGHAYMLEDQTYTQRQQVAKQPGTCLHCHASVYPAYKLLGQGDIKAGFEAINRMPYQQARSYVSHPVACIDCHDAQSMQLRITRPAFMEGIKALKASQGIKDYDVNRDASHQEMRSFVCGQCHVEYYFHGDEKRLVYPWLKGLKPENMLAYYDEIDFSDWTHAETGARVLKAQHPEFEMWNQGTHARAGVACADCHMPYVREGAHKVSDHWVRSPLLNIERACQTCHRVAADELLARVENIQFKTSDMRNKAIDALIEFIANIKAAQEKYGQQKSQALLTANIAQALKHQRHAQFLIDFVEAENSNGFHAPQEAMRILAEAINEIRKGELALMRGLVLALQ